MFNETVKKQRLKIAKEVAKLNLLLEKCPHENLESKCQYFEGTYLDLAYTEYWDQCVCCGKRFNERRTSHDWYN